ncbi:MAG: methyltransferase domain-containing protein [Deltaproteobacteria bacterium]|nr:methyltransferase domain-containing protein [Deltaproteobacteria bacterium]
MNKNHIEFFLCPACANAGLEIEAIDSYDNGEIKNGILLCRSCAAWYPVEDGVLELLVKPLRYEQDRLNFIRTFKDRIKSVDVARQPDPDLGREGYADQIKQQQHSDWFTENEQQTYSVFLEQPLWKAYDKIVFPEWIKKIRTNTAMLDVGCANGRSTFPFAEKNIDILGFDISKKLVRQAQEKYRTLRPAAAISFFVADGSNFPVKSSAFDYIVVHGVLHHLPDPAESCKEISRALKSGGLYLGSENNASIFRAIFDAMMKLKPLWREEAGSEPLMNSQKFLSWFNGLDIELRIKTMLYLPPHLINILGHAAAERAFKTTDAMFGHIPIINKQGGLILVEGRKK